MEELRQIKKVFNVEYDLDSEEFKAQKQDEISRKCQDMHPDFVCKVTTFCAKDKELVVSTTEENRALLGAVDRKLAQRKLAEQSFLNLDDEMVKTFEMDISKDADLPDYITAIDMAQAKADEMFEADDSKLPLITVIDYRWGNIPAELSATIFSDVDENGNLIPLVGGTDSAANVVVGDVENGKAIKESLENPNFVVLEAENYYITNLAFVQTGINGLSFDTIICEDTTISIISSEKFRMTKGESEAVDGTTYDFRDLAIQDDCYLNNITNNVNLIYTNPNKDYKFYRKGILVLKIKSIDTSL